MGIQAVEHPLGVLSVADEREVRAWSRSPLAPLLHAACFSFEIGWCKPETAACRCVLDRLGVAAGEAALVGDGGSGELQGARAAGFGQVVFMRGLVGAASKRGKAGLAQGADATVDALADLPVVLLNDLSGPPPE